VLIDRILRDLDLSMRAFAVCEIAPGWRLRMDGADWVTVHFAVDGSGRLRMADGSAVALPPHSLAIVPAHRAHSIEAGGTIEHETNTRYPAFDGDLAVFEAGPADVADELTVVCGRLQACYGASLGLFDRLTDPIVLDFDDSPRMKDLFERLMTEERDRSSTTGVMMTALMNEALILIFRRLCKVPECPLPWLTALEDPRLVAVLSEIHEHPDAAHSLDSLAASASMSRSSFSEAFGRHLGRSPMAYLRDIRMRRAASLLQGSGMTINAVAARVGYSSRSQFSRAFSARFGTSPAAYRRGYDADLEAP
jgi:AraC family transcriptional activator of mtrCDE